MQLINLFAFAPLMASIADASPARPAPYNGVQANSIPIAISSPECGIYGYDNTNSKTLITSVKVNTVAKCFTTCRQRQKCMSYGFCTQSNTCSLYKVALRKHIKRTNSSVIFYDRGCKNPAGPQSTRTTTSSATSTTTATIEDPITATATTITVTTTRSTTSARSTITGPVTIASTSTASTSTASTSTASTSTASTSTASTSTASTSTASTSTASTITASTATASISSTTTTTSASATATPAPGAAFTESLNSAYNEVLFGTNANVYDPRSDIASLADCEDLCAADTICVAVNFYRADDGDNVAGNCNLLSNILSGSAVTSNVDSARKN
ncbi:uncharacterized protein MYCGRDRAFT_95063 [Zymoseptoria tritici IPO323]|uniref:Apple domain-containing protein n=1 Tax=Zymoseptoria tritici (strain CBS 115943 / IPO323) TaxID=336722 RepID=F9XH72_ZYMTI|nr:uncharacterized protein MYCGRDRAFT_95063 [Zymoseptoria tritici IPO323]EGP84958.1 hypothetical protein MYCGRDRAFT_95063 [Zymoseptoria tritici IPO323]